MECNPVAAPGVHPPANLPVVRHRRGRPHVRTEQLGVTSIVRALNLHPRRYNASALFPLLRRQARPAHRAVDLAGASPVAQALRVNGRYVLVGDGIKIPKCGRKMPAVKLLHQQSNRTPSRTTSRALTASCKSARSGRLFRFVCRLPRASMRARYGPTATAGPCSTR